jgi:hypothetical protein
MLTTDRAAETARQLTPLGWLMVIFTLICAKLGIICMQHVFHRNTCTHAFLSVVH